MEDGTTILFGLPGVAVDRVERGDDGRVVHVVTADETAAACPACGVFSTSVKQHRTTRPRDLGYGEEPLAVRWHKRQFRCREAGCPRTAFTESIAELPPGARVTGRLRRAAAAAVDESGSVRGAADAHGISWPVVHAAFVAHAEQQLVEPAPVAVLGIDETRRGRPRWQRDASGAWVKLERFETNFVDLAGDGGLLGQTAGRTAAAVEAWLDARGQEWKAAVRVVAMDPCASYRRAVQDALPQARIVADHFHLVRLANDALTRVRQRVTRERLGRRGRRSDPAWANRRRLLRGRERLSERAFARMWNELVDADPTGELLAAWIAKEELRPAGHRPPRRAAARHRPPADPLLRLVHPGRRARAHHPGAGHRRLVARGARLPRDRHHERRDRGGEPADQGHDPCRIRLPLSGKPAPPGTVPLHTTPTNGVSRCEDIAPSTLRSPIVLSATLHDPSRRPGSSRPASSWAAMPWSTCTSAPRSARARVRRRCR